MSRVIVNLRDRSVSKGDGQVMSAMCSLFYPSLIALIASSVSPSKDTPAILVDFLQTCSFPNYQSLRLEEVGFHEFVRYSGSSTGLSTVKDLAQFGIKHFELFPVVGFIGRRMLISLYQL